MVVKLGVPTGKLSGIVLEGHLKKPITGAYSAVISFLFTIDCL
jgi:hypothetical protein